MNAIIIDDEEHCINRLEHLLKDYCPEIKIVKSCQDIDSAFNKINELKPDVIFLDVQIHDATGFDLLRKFDKIDFEIIFMTAFEHYAVQAFRFSALDYLLKPIDSDDLISAVEKLKTKIQGQNSSTDNFELLLQNFNNLRQKNKKITVPTIYGFEMISTQDILYCKSDVNYTTLFLKDQKSFTVARTLKEFESVLAQYDFFRINNSYVVNLDYIRSYNKGKGGFVKLENGVEIEVSSRRKDDFLIRLNKLT
mgnify:FL=1